LGPLTNPANARYQVLGVYSPNLTQILADVFRNMGTKRDIVVLNAAHIFVATEKAEDIKEGIKLAEDSIDSGAALNKLNALREETN